MEDHRRQKMQQQHVDNAIPGIHQIAVYLGKCWSVVTDAAVLLAITIAVYFIVLYICKISWHLYIATETGKMFVNYFPEEAESTSQFLQLDIMKLSVWITVYSFIISSAVASICRLLYFSQYLYEQFGLLGKTIFCGLPMTAIVAFYVQPLYEFPAWDTTYAVVLLPTLAVYNRCFNYAATLLPEFGDLKKLILR